MPSERLLKITNAKINMAFILADIAESLILECDRNLIDIGKINPEITSAYKRVAKDLREIVYSIGREDADKASRLGELSDVVRPYIDEVIKKISGV